jgi:hypothetical protein
MDKLSIKEAADLHTSVEELDIKIAIITAMWKRPEVFRLFAMQVQYLQFIYGANRIKCFVAGSEGEISEAAAMHYGFTYVEHENKPISKKLDAACQLAREWNPDYCLMLGSDDLVGITMMEMYLREALENKTDYLYTLDCYFYDIVSKRSLYWGGYRSSNNRGHACGAGRMLSNKLMEAMDWTPWKPAHTNARLDGLLDTAMDYQMAGIEHTQKAFNLRDENAYMVDIKSSTNMTPFRKWDNTDFVDSAPMLASAFPQHISHEILTCTE